MTTILITVDSLRYDFVFGDRRDYSLPAIDRLASNGVVFERAFANASYTADSFTSILGGTHPWRYGTQTEGFEPDRPHIVEPFADADYETVGIYANPFLDETFGYDRGFDTYVNGDQSDPGILGTARQYVVETLPPESLLYKTIRWSHRTVTSALGTELEGRPYPDASVVVDTFDSAVTDAPEPVFGWLHFMDVHSPFYPHEGTRSEGIDESRAVSTFYSANKRPTEVSEEERDLLIDLYIGELQYLDRQLGRLFSLLKREFDEPTILFTSDHGEAFGEHGFCFHPKELYEELVRIPTILQSPTCEPGTEQTPVSNVDIYPTLVDDAGLSSSPEVAGDPLQQLRAEPPTERHVFAQAIDDQTMKAMVCDGRYKLIHELRTEQTQLFDLQTDPDETADVDNPAVREELSGALETHLDGMQIDTNDGSQHDVPDEVSDRLEQLGYK